MARYSPREVHTLEALNDELRRLAGALESVADGYADVFYVEPARPREGQRVYADGTEWNPGAGAGLYLYTSGAWSKL